MAQNDTTPHPAPVRRPRWHLPDSYQGRYLLLATLLIFLLLAVAWAGRQQVTRITGQQVERLETRTQLLRRLDDALQWREEVNAWLHRQLMEPGVRQQLPLQQTLHGLRRHLQALRHPSLSSADRKTVDELVNRQWKALAELSYRFLAISLNNRLRFPSTRIMQTRMLDKADTFDQTTRNLLEEAATLPDRLPLQLALQRLRNHWQSMLSDFRLLVANRFGVFADDPMNGMRARAVNIEIQYHHLLDQLQALARKPLPKDGLFFEPGIWSRLERLVRQWHTRYLAVAEQLRGPHWRRDLEMYKEELTPLLDGIHRNLQRLRSHLEQQSTADIQGIAGLAQSLSLTLLLVVAVAVTAILATYFYLRLRIFDPIAGITRALRREATGVGDHPTPRPLLRETRDLVAAFEEMRHEVARRRKHLDYLAHHDALTHLPNRVLFKDRLSQAIKRTGRNRPLLALLFLDLDNFKQINDSLGHMAGDDLLITVAGRLKKLLRSGDTVARLGGDEFAILLDEIDGKRQARSTAERILAALAEPVELTGQTFHLSASLGIAMAPHDADTPDELIQAADAAMYEAKRKGKNAYHFYSAELLARATHQLNLERALRRAIEHGEFLFHYQPIVHTRSRKIYGVEALMRWQPPHEALRNPDQFMDTLLTLDVRQQVLRQLLEGVARLQSHCLETLDLALPVSINLSASVLRNTAHHETLLKILQGHRFPELLRIEITEDTLLEDLSRAHMLLQEIRRLGMPLVLDDFGTGQSSLNHLRSFPFDAIKIDKEFVLNLDHNEEDARLVKAVTRLAHDFDMKVVAEGVEREAHRDYLARIGCDYLQGWLISKPLSQQRLLALLERLHRRRIQRAERRTPPRARSAHG